MARNELSLQITGVKELLSNLNRIEKVIVNEFERIIKTAAGEIAKDARNRAPRRTEELAGSIEVKDLEIKGNIIKIGVGPVGKDIFYWYFVEFGTVNMAAQPFLRPAFDENKNEIKKEINRELKALINREGIK